MQNTVAIKSFSPFQILPLFWPVASMYINRAIAVRQMPAKIFDFLWSSFFMLITLTWKINTGVRVAVGLYGVPKCTRGAMHRMVGNGLLRLPRRLWSLGQVSNRIRYFLSAVNISLAQGHHALAIFVRALFETISGTLFFHADKCASATKREGEWNGN